MKIRRFFLLFLLFQAGMAAVNAQPPAQGFLPHHRDVGPVQIPGSFTYSAATQQYEITASGTNIWLTKDEFHYAYTQLKGDFILQARLSFMGKGVDPHRKAGWMLRESFDTSSRMAAATVHGDGLTALQFRREENTNIEEIRSPVSAPDVVQLERKGHKLIMSVARFGQPFTITSVADVHLSEVIYAGLFVCSHNNAVTERVVFRNLQLIRPTPPGFVPYKDYLGSHIETMEVSTGLRTIEYTDWNKSLQAPNWMPDGHHLLYNSEGRIYTYGLKNKKVAVLNTDTVTANNNDHVISFDGKWLGLSSSSGETAYGSLIYLTPLRGGKARRITPTGPSYLHGFSPDGKWMTFTGLRNGDYDIYKIPVDGGPEQRLTDTKGLDDGSEYSPDGQYIYYNSVRSGSMELWRMKPDGTGHEQLTKDEFNNWFPHISPDGKWIAFLSYNTDVAPGDHPFYKKVYLRLMPTDLSSPPKVIAYLYGGQGTINTPSWSPDSKKIAFVSNSGRW